MKIQNELKQLQSIHDFEQYFNNQHSSNSQSYQRIKQEVKNLIFQPPQNFKIAIFEETKVRIILRIWYFVSNSLSQQRKMVNIKSKRNNQRKKSPLKFNRVQKIFMQDDEESIEVKKIFEQKSLSEQNYILFTCIIDYGIYPFSPPYLMVTENIGLSYDLSINNFSNITDEILCNSNWFPSFTIEDILKNIPKFVQNLKQSESAIKSSYYYEKPFRKLDIYQHALGLKIFEGEVYDEKDTLIGKYAKKVIGITFKSLIFFKKDDMNGLKVCNIFPLNEIDKIKIEQNQKRIKFTVNLKEKVEIIYKFLSETNSKKSLEQIQIRDHFLNWMKLCLLHTIYETFKKNKALPAEGYINLKQILTKKSSKVHNQNNENSIHNFTKILEQKDLSERRKEIQKVLIQKQEQILGILQTVDLLLSSSIYKTYESDPLEQVDKLVYFTEKGVTITQLQSNYHINNKSNRKLIEKGNQNPVDLTKNEFIKLKHYKKSKQSELKQLFSLFQ